MQVEGIYTATASLEAQAKALKLKQEMAAAAEEEQKRLRGMPGLDLVETPKPLERQIRAEVEAKVKERAPEAVRQTQTSKVFAKPEKNFPEPAFKILSSFQPSVVSVSCTVCGSCACWPPNPPRSRATDAASPKPAMLLGVTVRS